MGVLLYMLAGTCGKSRFQFLQWYIPAISAAWSKTHAGCSFF
jgi:hypothetical protein